MIRLLLIISTLFTINSYALIQSDTGKKKIPVDIHLDHPDHVPHHGGKDPIKKISHDDGIIPRKRKKGNILVAS
jgi:hypothetical protein